MTGLLEIQFGSWFVALYLQFAVRPSSPRLPRVTSKLAISAETLEQQVCLLPVTSAYFKE